MAKSRCFHEQKCSMLSWWTERQEGSLRAIWLREKLKRIAHTQCCFAPVDMEMFSSFLPMRKDATLQRSGERTKKALCLEILVLRKFTPPVFLFQGIINRN